MFALYRTARVQHCMTITLNELHLFLSSQPWNKKKNVRSKGLESGKRCICTCTSHVASGVENGQVVLPFAECWTLSYFHHCASSSSASNLVKLCSVFLTAISVYFEPISVLCIHMIYSLKFRSTLLYITLQPRQSPL